MMRAFLRTFGRNLHDTVTTKNFWRYAVVLGVVGLLPGELLVLRTSALYKVIVLFILVVVPEIGLALSGYSLIVSREVYLGHGDTMPRLDIGLCLSKGWRALWLAFPYFVLIFLTATIVVAVTAIWLGLQSMLILEASLIGYVGAMIPLLAYPSYIAYNSKKAKRRPFFNAFRLLRQYPHMVAVFATNAFVIVVFNLVYPSLLQHIASTSGRIVYISSLLAYEYSHSLSVSGVISVIVLYLIFRVAIQILTFSNYRALGLFAREAYPPSNLARCLAKVGGLGAVIFDMDGVLFDTERLAREVWRKVFSEYGLEFTDDCYKEIIGRTIKDAMIILDKAYGHHIPLQELNEKQEALYQDYITRPLPLKPGADELLDWLAQNDIPCALGSSTYHDQVSAILQRNNLSDCFQVLVGGDDVARGKPAPDIFLAAARQLQVAPERCLIIEDSENGLRAANAAGAVTVMVPDLIAPMEIDTTLKFLTFDTLGALIPALEASR